MRDGQLDRLVFFTKQIVWQLAIQTTAKHCGAFNMFNCWRIWTIYTNIIFWCALIREGVVVLMRGGLAGVDRGMAGKGAGQAELPGRRWGMSLSLVEGAAVLDVLVAGRNYGSVCCGEGTNV